MIPGGMAIARDNTARTGSTRNMTQEPIITHLQQKAGLTVGGIGLFGSSMGAAVAIQVAAADERVSAVVAESGFATLRTIFDDYQKRMIRLPWHYLRNIVIKRSEQLAHFKASAVSPLEACKQIHVPLFIIHGTGDRLIKPSYSRLLYENANDQKSCGYIERAESQQHGRSGRGGLLQEDS
jgi:pimeloyl-ACP methyl ester carboxylesterase